MLFFFAYLTLIAAVASPESDARDLYARHFLQHFNDHSSLISHRPPHEARGCCGSKLRGPRPSRPPQPGGPPPPGGHHAPPTSGEHRPPGELPEWPLGFHHRRRRPHPIGGPYPPGSPPRDHPPPSHPAGPPLPRPEHKSPPSHELNCEAWKERCGNNCICKGAILDCGNAAVRKSAIRTEEYIKALKSICEKSCTCEPILQLEQAWA